MLSNKKDESAQKRLYEVLCWATDALPKSVDLWQARLRYHLAFGQEDSATAAFAKVDTSPTFQSLIYFNCTIFIEQATEILGEKSLPLWRMRLLHVQTKSPEKTEQIFQAALQEGPTIARDMKPTYIEWLVLSKSESMTTFRKIAH